MYIYKIVDINTGRVYIGKTEGSCKKRQVQHWNLLKKGKHHNVQLQRVYNKDPSRLVFEIVEKDISDRKQLDLLEIYYIQQLGSLNMTKGGDGGDTITNHPDRESIVKKIRAASKQLPGVDNWNYKPVPKKLEDQIMLLWQSLSPPSIEEISKLTQLTRHLVRRTLTDNSINIPSRIETQKALIRAGKLIPNRRGIFTEEQKDAIVKMYVESWISCSSIGKVFGLKGESAILRVLKEREVKLRSRSEWTTYNNLNRSKNGH